MEEWRDRFILYFPHIGYFFSLSRIVDSPFLWNSYVMFQRN